MSVIKCLTDIDNYDNCKINGDRVNSFFCILEKKKPHFEFSSYVSLNTCQVIDQKLKISNIEFLYKHTQLRQMYLS